jgi:hypothetical protein
MDTSNIPADVWVCVAEQADAVTIRLMLFVSKEWHDACITTYDRIIGRSVTPIEQAICNGNIELFERLLLDDPHSSMLLGTTACNIAARHNRLEMLVYLMVRGYDHDESTYTLSC